MTAYLFHLPTKNLRSCNLHSTPLLLKEHGVDLLLQDCNYGEELLLSSLGGAGTEGYSPCCCCCWQNIGDGDGDGDGDVDVSL